MERLQLVSRETAILAKNKGFNWSCFWHITKNSDLKGTGYFSANKRGGIDLPEQALLAKWLRDRDIHVWCKFVEDGYEYYIGIEQSEGWYTSYEEALEAGLQYALTLIKLIE